MDQKPKSKYEDEFFGKNIVKKSSCSLWAIITLLLILLLIGISFIYFERSKFLKSSANINISTSDITSKIQKSNIEQSNPQKTIITLSESDLSNLIISKNVDFPLKNPKVKITGEKIIVSGKTGAGIISLNTEVGVLPKLNNQKLILEIIDIKTAGVSSPQKVKDLINNQLSGYLDKVTSNFGDYKIESIEIEEGYIILAVKNE